MQLRHAFTFLASLSWPIAAAAQNQAWLRQFGTSAMDYVGAVAFDGTGGAYLSGGTF